MVVGGFSEMWVDWIDDHGGTAFLFGENTALLYSGELMVTYAYSAAEE